MALRIAQVGMGGWGRDWAKNIPSQVPEVEPVAWVDSDPQALVRARATLGLPPDRCFGSLRQALAAARPDAVLVTAVLPAHVPLALEALDAGKHVLVEKPFAPTLAEARRVRDAAAERGLIAMVSQNYRFYPAVRAAAALVREGELGRLGAVHIEFRRYANRAPREGNRHYSLPQPLLVDMSIHHFDLMRAVIGAEPAEIHCHAWNPPWSNFGDPATALATVTFGGGVCVGYSGSWVSTGPRTAWAGEWRMELERGEVAWTSRADTGLGEERVSVRPLDGPERELNLPALPHFDRAGSLAAFAEAVSTGREPETSASDNLNTLALTLAAVESARAGQPVPLRDFIGA